MFFLLADPQKNTKILKLKTKFQVIQKKNHIYKKFCN